MSPRWKRRAVAAAVVVVGTVGAVVGAPQSHAGVAQPGPLTGMQVVRVTPSSLTVTVSGAARRYRLFVAPHKRDLELAVINRARRTRLSRSPVLTMRGLRYSTSPWFYRVEALNGPGRHRFTRVGGLVGLLPAAPTGVTASATVGGGLSLSWHSGPATGFVVTGATSPDMTQNRFVFARAGLERQFSPYGLTPGMTYYFTVRSLNHLTPSPPSPVVSGVAPQRTQPVRVMTYNLLKSLLDGKKERGNTIEPWSKRVVAEVGRINSARPDVIAVQEGSSWVDSAKQVRQAQSLARHLTGFSVAPTAAQPDAPHFARAGGYVLYDNTRYRAVGDGGWWNDGDFRWSAYQELENVASGARFVVVSAHLLPNLSHVADNARRAETQRLVAQGAAISARLGVPVVYAGDFNSNTTSTYTYDAPGVVMNAAGVDDTYDLAGTRVNPRFNSFNKFLRRPPATGARIDRIFAPPGVAVGAWGTVVPLTHGLVPGTMPSDHNPVYSDLLLPY